MPADVRPEEQLRDLVFGVLHRQKHIHNLGNRLITESARHVHAHPLRSQVRIDRDRKTVRFLGAVDHPLVLPEWELLLGDFLFNARALLDNLVWLCCHLDPSVTYSSAEERGIYFPICKSQEEWEQVCKKKHFRMMESALVERLRLCQPFVYDEVSPDILDWLHDLNRFDKHRTRARLLCAIDPKWPLTYDLFNGHERILQEDMQVTWHALPGEPNVFKEIVLVRTEQPVARATPLRVFWALFVTRADSTAARDLQDFIWDVLVRVQRIQEIVIEGQPGDSELALKEMERSRSRSEALKRSVEEGGDDFESYKNDPPTVFLRHDDPL